MLDERGFVLRDQLLDEFNRWCSRHNYTRCGSVKFWREFRRRFKDKIASREIYETKHPDLRNIAGKNANGWKGLTISMNPTESKRGEDFSDELIRMAKAKAFDLHTLSGLQPAAALARAAELLSVDRVAMRDDFADEYAALELKYREAGVRKALNEVGEQVARLRREQEERGGVPGAAVPEEDSAPRTEAPTADTARQLDKPRSCITATEAETEPGQQNETPAGTSHATDAERASTPCGSSDGSEELDELLQRLEGSSTSGLSIRPLQETES